MTKGQLAVASPAILLADRALPAALAAEGWNVWYLGNDYARLLELRAAFLDTAHFAPVGERVGAAAQMLLPLALDLDGALADSGFDRDAWDASDLADRSR